MTGNARTTPPATADLPPILRDDLASPPLERASWVWTIGPAYAGVFVVTPFFDRLGAWLPAGGGPGGTIAVAVLGVLACYSLLYSIPALWGWRAGHRLSVVAASTFGARGSEWIAGVGVALGAVLMYAVSIASALRFTMLGLVSCGLADATALRAWRLGPLTLESPVFLLTAAFWIFITGMASLLRLAPVIFALMQVYTPVALALLGASALLANLGWGPAGAGLDAADLASLPASPGGPSLFQWVFGYFAFSGLLSVEWGMAVRHRRDVRIGGWLGVLLAGSYAASMALLTAAGARASAGSGPVAVVTFHDALLRGIGGVLGGAFLMLFGLATLAPACYSAWIFSRRLASHWRRVRRFLWIWIGGAVAFVLIATSWADRLEAVFTLLGAAFAPAVGALSADALLQRLRWNGIREGWNGPGLIAWGIGFVVGLAPWIGEAAGLAGLDRLQPASLAAYAASLLVHLALSALGMGNPLAPLPEQAEERGAPAAAAS